MKLNLLFTLYLTFVTTFSLIAQNIVAGTITDEDGVFLPGASITVLDSNVGTISDFDGKFSIQANTGDTLIVSYVGYTNQEIVVSENSNFQITLRSNLLDEVVVTALGISREKKSLGYSVSEISGDNVNTIKDNNLANSLTGKVAGLQISTAGSLGSGSRITIRGNNSLGGNSQALIVVDGMPINSSLPLGNDGGQRESGANDSGGSPSFEPSIGGGGIADINPDDVESISVLKGPAASALYGSRAGNGVILITTKRVQALID